MSKIFDNWKLSLQSQSKTEYINEDIRDISELSRTKKRRAKKAICWLLSKSSHSVIEIADHFYMSPELVNGLIEELTKNNLVVQVPGTTRYNSSINLQCKVVHDLYQSHRRDTSHEI